MEKINVMKYIILIEKISIIIVILASIVTIFNFLFVW